ncbi:MAG: translation initiation factor IF-3 [Clostridia bacterium]|nr:translation initiation factor IF-3 [Clostridia bacterium]
MATKDILVNEAIRCKEVRVINQEGQQLGIMAPESALQIAYNAGLDLIMISPGAQPPVCRIADYGRYRFEQDKREKEAKKKQNIIEIKEVQLSCRIDTHDFETKVNHAIRFLKDGNKVKVVLRFRGREMSHQQLGRDNLTQFENSVAEYGTVEKAPVLEGRLMTMMIAPIRDSSKKGGQKKEKPNADPAPSEGSAKQE